MNSLPVSFKCTCNQASSKAFALSFVTCELKLLQMNLKTRIKAFFRLSRQRNHIKVFI